MNYKSICKYICICAAEDSVSVRGLGRLGQVRIRVYSYFLGGGNDVKTSKFVVSICTRTLLVGFRNRRFYGLTSHWVYESILPLVRRETCSNWRANSSFLEWEGLWEQFTYTCLSVTVCACVGAQGDKKEDKDQTTEQVKEDEEKQNEQVEKGQGKDQKTKKVCLCENVSKRCWCKRTHVIHPWMTFSVCLPESHECSCGTHIRTHAHIQTMSLSPILTYDLSPPRYAHPHT